MMNWIKILANVLSAGGACLAAHSIAGQGVTSGMVWYGVALCVAANLGGLFQSSPSAPTVPKK